MVSAPEERMALKKLFALAIYVRVCPLAALRHELNRLDRSTATRSPPRLPAKRALSQTTTCADTSTTLAL